MARDLAAQILRDSAPVDVLLIAHGPAARRRRFVRALLPALMLVGSAGVAISVGTPLWFGAAAIATIPIAAMLAADRYRSLGHALSGTCLVTRQGSLDRRRDVLECDGIIGWNMSETFFQRRAGLATLTATTAAGRQRYAVTDVPLPLGVCFIKGVSGVFI